MNDGFFLAGSSLAAVLAVGLALRRRRERSMLDAWALRHGWSVNPRAGQELMERLAGLALMQIGHSRRVLTVVHDPNGVQLFEYVFETGLEHDRETHRWMVVVVPLMTTCTRATISDERWVLAAASHPAFRRIAVGSAPVNGNGARMAVVDDEEAWHATLSRQMGNRLTSEPKGRSWEVLPDLLVGYQASPVADKIVGDLVSAAKEISKMV